MLALSLVLVSALDNPAYSVREAAEAALARIGPAAWPAVVRGLSDESPETRRRCDWLAAPIRRAAERSRVRAAVWDLLDGPLPPSYRDICRMYDDHNVREGFIRELASRGCPVGNWPYRYLSPVETGRLDAWHGYYLGLAVETARNAYGTPRPFFYPAWNY